MRVIVGAGGFDWRSPWRRLAWEDPRSHARHRLRLDGALGRRNNHSSRPAGGVRTVVSSLRINGQAVEAEAASWR